MSLSDTLWAVRRATRSYRAVSTVSMWKTSSKSVVDMAEYVGCGDGDGGDEAVCWEDKKFQCKWEMKNFEIIQDVRLGVCIAFISASPESL